MIQQISDNTGHKNQEMGSNGFLNKTRFLHFYSTQSWGNYHQQVEREEKGHKLSSLFNLFCADIFSIADCRHASDKKFKTFYFLCPQFLDSFPERSVFWKLYILQQKDKWQVNKVILGLCETLKSNRIKVWLLKSSPHTAVSTSPYKNFLSL